jgi:hypothetical protein
VASASPATPEDWQRASQVLTVEYTALIAALNAAWSASLTRTSLFLGVLSAAGVAFGFAAQGGMESSTFLSMALAVFLLVRRPYFVLPVHDDPAALYRSIGTGMTLRPPRFQLLHLTAQTQGIVGIVTAVVAAGCAGIARTRWVAGSRGWQPCSPLW